MKAKANKYFDSILSTCILILIVAGIGMFVSVYIEPSRQDLQDKLFEGCFSTFKIMAGMFIGLATGGRVSKAN